MKQFFRKKPVVIEAMQWTGENLYDVTAFIEGSLHIRSGKNAEAWEQYQERVKGEGLIIQTLEGQHIASIGDWIIKGVKGEFYPCKPDIFSATYDSVEAP